MMKERFAKLLLGEDMSGSGKGVNTALAISNAITNLCGTFSFSINFTFPANNFDFCAIFFAILVIIFILVYNIEFVLGMF